jgi:hypothetical protein
MSSWKSVAGLLCATMAIAALPILAQVQAGRIVGTVYDPNRALVPNATVVVTETATNLAKKVTADAAGDFVVTPLNPGTYSVSATAPGFRTTVQTGIELQVGQAVRVGLELRLGETTTTVEVTAEVPLLNTESGNVGHVINNTQIVDLPLNGRNFTELGRLTPGAVLLPATGSVSRIRPENINGTSISGVQGQQVTFLLDGVDISEQHQGGTFIQTSIDALQEFSVQQNAYSAEYSRAGGFFNATTKGGGNKVHGALFEFLRNDKLDARDFFALKREILKRNQFGGTVSGPVVIPKVYNGRDSTFFFLSYEALRERQGVIFNNTVPTVAQRTGDYSAAGLNLLYDPLTTRANPAGSGTIRDPFAGNVISPTRIASQATYFAKYMPVANSGSNRAIFGPSRATGEDQLTIRGDQKISANNRMFGRFSFFDNRMSDPHTAPALGNADLWTRGENVAGSLSSNIRPTMVHELRFTYLISWINNAPFLLGTDFNKEAGITGLEETKRPGVIGSFPDFAWSGYTSINGSAFDQRPKTQDRMSWELSDNFTWIKNKHLIKFGGKIRYNRWLGTDSKTYQGSWTFNGQNTENPAKTAGTGDSWADFLLGFPTQVARAYPGNTFGGYGTYWHGFIQDDWKVSNKLTLNIGLRYEYSPFFKGYKGQVGTFDGTLPKPIIIASETSSLDLSTQYCGPAAYALFKDLIQTSSQAGLPYAMTYPNKRDLAPRFGLAWRPFGDKTVVRGGYGIFYEAESTNGRVNLNMIPWTLGETAIADRGTVPVRTMGNFFLGASVGSFLSPPSLTPTRIRMRTPYDQHWNFGIQHQVARTLVLEVDYVGNRGLFLRGDAQGTDPINFPSPGAGTIQTRRPYPRFGTINYNSDNLATSYHSLQGKLEKRFSSGVWALVSYTFSKSMQFAATPAKGGNTGWEKALSPMDVPQNFAASFGYQLPFGKGKKYLNTTGGLVNALLGGWQTQGIMVATSGRIFTPTISRDQANTGVGGQRPNRIGSGKLANPTLGLWFDKAAFVLPAQYTYGNSGGGILRGDGYRNFDFSIFKRFRIAETSHLEFRSEAFNLANMASFSLPNTVIDTAAGGTVTSTSSSSRRLQFALKLTF